MARDRRSEYQRARLEAGQRYGLTPYQLRRVRTAQRAPHGATYYVDLPFPSIDLACRWAREQLGVRDASFIACYGRLRDTGRDSNYEVTKTTGRGWASISSLRFSTDYRPVQVDMIKDNADVIFTDILRVVLKVKPWGE